MMNKTEKIKKAYNNRKREQMTIYDSIAVFKQKVSWGSIYPCISCEGYYFRSGVIKANMEKMKQKQIFEEAVDIVNIYNKSQFHVKNSFWICKCCNDSIN